MKKIVLAFLAIAVSTTAWAGNGGLKKALERAKEKKKIAEPFEPLIGFSAFSERNEAKIKEGNYILTGETQNGSGQSIAQEYSQDAINGHKVYVDTDPVTGAVKKVTQVIEIPQSQLVSTNQIDYVEGTLSHCANYNSKPKKGERKITCSTITRDMCSRGGDKKDVKGIQSKHLSIMSSQMSRVKSVSTGRRDMANLAKNKDMRKKMCEVFDGQPMHVAPPAQQPVATPPVDGAAPPAGGATPPPTSTVPAAPTTPDDGIYRAPQPGSQ